MSLFDKDALYNAAVDSIVDEIWEKSSIAAEIAELSEERVPCPNIDEIQVCPDCKEWTGICQPCCSSGRLCDLCEGENEIDVLDEAVEDVR